MTRVCGVLGDPIEHSLSPAIHRAAYASLGLPWRYDAHRVDVAGLDAFVAGLGPQWRGLSVTMPLKEALLDVGERLGLPESDWQVDPLARLLRSANTVVREPRADGVRTLLSNTDAPGLAAALREIGRVPRGGEMTILGAGATARSAMAAARELGLASVRVSARRLDAAAELIPLAEALDLDMVLHPWGAPVRGTTMIVSTVPAAGVTPFEFDTPVVFDVIYDPWPTPLARAAVARGARVLGGLDLLAHQAVLQVEAFTGRRVDVEIARRAASDALRARRGS